MAKIVKFPVTTSPRIGYKKVRKCRRVNLEDYGQLNMFTTPPPEAKVVGLQSFESPFEQALQLDELNSEKAAEFYWKAIQMNDCVADAYCNLGILESGREKYIKAIDCFTHCLKRDPRHFEAHYNLANVYADVGELPLARVHYEISIEIEPEFESAYYNLGLIMAQQSDFEAAIKIFNAFRSLATEREKLKVDKVIQDLQRSLETRVVKK